MRYIHNNPVKAKIVSKASDYQWSSYKEYTEEKSRLIDLNERRMILSLFSYSTEQFKRFHLEEETNEFLEVKEDLKQEREERAQKIINRYFERYGIKDIGGFNNRKGILEDVIIELLKKSCLSHRRIAELLEISRGTVHNLSKKHG